LLTAAILWGLYTASDSVHLQPPANDPAVQLSLVQAPEPPRPEPEKPKPRPPPVRQRIVAPAPAPDPPPVVNEPQAEATDDAIVMAPAPPPPPAPHASVEAAYAAAVRETVDARTGALDTGAFRLRRPSGEVLVRFLVDRAGNPSQVAIARTSGSRILDTQALQIVSSGHYPPFPEAAFPSESGHTFLVHIEFP
jgi:protein TonB